MGAGIHVHLIDLSGKDRDATVRGLLISVFPLIRGTSAESVPALSRANGRPIGRPPQPQPSHALETD